MTHYKSQSANSQDNSNVDLREKLYNDREIGPVTISDPESIITRLHGILLDVDPLNYRKSRGANVRSNPEKFYLRVIKTMLLRHAVLARAEVRLSGTGLHIIIWFAEPVELKTEGDRLRWVAIIKAIQRLLPTDHLAPAITAMTRPLGSRNGKNQKKVKCLHRGEPVPPADILKLFDQLSAKPFATVAQVLFGEGPIRPCPICNGEGSSLGVLSATGKCYGGCGKVKLSQLYDVFLETKLSAGKGN